MEFGIQHLAIGIKENLTHVYVHLSKALKLDSTTKEKFKFSEQRARFKKNIQDSSEFQKIFDPLAQQDILHYFGSFPKDERSTLLQTIAVLEYKQKKQQTQIEELQFKLQQYNCASGDLISLRDKLKKIATQPIDPQVDLKVVSEVLELADTILHLSGRIRTDQNTKRGNERKEQKSEDSTPQEQRRLGEKCKSKAPLIPSNDSEILPSKENILLSKEQRFERTLTPSAQSKSSYMFPADLIRNKKPKYPEDDLLYYWFLYHVAPGISSSSEARVLVFATAAKNIGEVRKFALALIRNAKERLLITSDPSVKIVRRRSQPPLLALWELFDVSNLDLEGVFLSFQERVFQLWNIWLPLIIVSNEDFVLKMKRDLSLQTLCYFYHFEGSLYCTKPISIQAPVERPTNETNVSVLLQKRLSPFGDKDDQTGLKEEILFPKREYSS